MKDQNPTQAIQAFWHTQRVKRLVRQHFGSGAAVLISVRETICTDQNCPGPRTEIRISDLLLREMRLTIHKPVSTVCHSDVSQLILIDE